MFWRTTAGKTGLYPSISKKHKNHPVRAMTDFIAYADGTNDLVDISNIIGRPVWDFIAIIDKLMESGLLEVVG